MRRIKRGVLGLLLSPVVFIAAFSSASCSISAYADDRIDLENSNENAKKNGIQAIDNAATDSSNYDITDDSDNTNNSIIAEDVDNTENLIVAGDLDNTKNAIVAGVDNNISNADDAGNSNNITDNENNPDIAEPKTPHAQNQGSALLVTEDQASAYDDESAASYDFSKSNYDFSKSNYDFSESTYDVCFYIKGAGIGADIPSEPQFHFGELYSSAIRINDAVTYENLSLSTHEEDGSEDSLLADNFTAANSVSEMLSKVPDASAIKSVVPEFDENKHYVVWYVMKASLSSLPNWDVYLHVDGVIRERSTSINQEEEPDTPTEDPNTPSVDPNKPIADPSITPDKPAPKPPVSEDGFTPEEIEALEELGREVEIEIETLFLDENGNEVKEIPYDGNEHLVGGFAINVIDKAEHSLLEQLRYNYRGELITYAADDCTYFNVRDRVFSINVTGAYARAKDLGEAVISFYSGSTKLNGPEDIQISDEKGRAITSYLNVIPKTGSVSVTQPITLEAGTTVRNDDGQTLTDDSYEITKGALLDGHRIESVVLLGSQTGAGESSNEITSVVIVDSEGNDVTSRYHIDTVKGRLVLVDAGDKKDSSSESSGSDNAGTNTSKADDTTISANGVSLGAAPASLINYETVKIENIDGKTTIVKVPYDFGAANTNENTPSVLGARMSATGDNNTASTRIMLVLISIVTIASVVSHFKKGSSDKDENEEIDKEDAA